MASSFSIPQVLSTEPTPTSPNEASNTLSPTRRASLSKTVSLQPSRRMASSSMSKLPMAGARFGSSAQPIEPEEQISINDTHQKHSKTSPESRHSSKDGSDSLATRDPHSLRGPNFEGEPRTLIDLDELENFDDLWNDEEELQILRVEERKVSQPQSSKIAVLQRNPPIVAPLVKIPEWQHKNLLLRPSKTVELLDGDFLLITDVMRHSTLGEVTIRGQRLQRCRSMNGLLERKLNEVCFFQEVDLDDTRPPLEQSAIEISVEPVEVAVDNVRGLRSLRKTNQIFPLGRNLDVQTFRTQLQADVEGGLTARWKYTCKYATSADRWHNNSKERALEFLREDESTKGFGVSDAARRFDWRGETIPGGAYRPELDDGTQFIVDGRNDSVISIAGSTCEPESDCIIIASPATSSEAARSGKRNSQSTLFSLPTPSSKRRASSSSVILLRDASTQNSKKVRLESRDEVEIEITREDLSTLSVQEQQIMAGRASSVAGMAVLSSSGHSRRRSEVGTNIPLPPSQRSLPPKLSSPIDLSSSDLATPSPGGTIRSNSASAHGSIIRSPGQMLTYGDAFCGAGGTTRGAAMAGLQVLWGFDHWNHACATWRTNFSQAKCYELSSQQFVGRAQGSKYRKAIDMKVDILHLSPPCQYFSPAHTVDCPSDEMNVASLYAVGPVIKVAKPRVVTLEQTFGIAAARFRKYFNSLIQMFTALSFSVRWAIVPLAQWVCPSHNPCRQHKESNSLLGATTTAVPLDYHRSLVTRPLSAHIHQILTPLQSRRVPPCDAQSHTRRPLL